MPVAKRVVTPQIVRILCALVYKLIGWWWGYHNLKPTSSRPVASMLSLQSLARRRINEVIKDRDYISELRIPDMLKFSLEREYPDVDHRKYPWKRTLYYVEDLLSLVRYNKPVPKQYMTAILYELRTHSVYCIGIWHLVKMKYVIESENKQWYPMCKKCFTRQLSIDFDDDIYLDRRHTICDGFTSLCDYVMDQRNWCTWCKNTPLFELLRESVCVATYGEKLHECPCSYGCVECTNGYRDYWCILQRCPEDIYLL